MNEELSELERKVKNCKKCDLWKKRNKPVFGEGPDDAKVMLIGMGPGYWENQKGRPFVGAAGKFLNELLSLAGLKREDVYITNVVKCYLPGNKVTEEEIKACTPYLDRQIEIVKPKVIITLGNVATEYIFNKFNLPLASMGNLHSKLFTVSNLLLHVKVIPMYHPAAALRNPGLRSTIEEDWRNIKKEVVE